MTGWKPPTRIGLLAPGESQEAVLTDHLRHALLYFEKVIAMFDLDLLPKEEREVVARSRSVAELLCEIPESDNPMELFAAPPAEAWFSFEDEYFGFEISSERRWDPIALSSEIERAVDHQAMVVPFYSSPSVRTIAVAGSPCLEVVLKALPVPDRSVPLKEVIEFVADPEVVAKRRALFNWQNEIERQDLQPFEIVELIATLLDDYCRYMHLQTTRFRLVTLKQIVVLVPAVLEELVRIRPSRAIETLFSLSELRMNLKDSELVAPGREVAYIAEAQRRFD